MRLLETIANALRPVPRDAEYFPPSPDPDRAPPTKLWESTAAAQRIAEDIEVQILQGDRADRDFTGILDRSPIYRWWVPAPPRPDVVVGQNLQAAYGYVAERGWDEGAPSPIVMSTAPHDGYGGRVLLIITDPTTLDGDVWRQLQPVRAEGRLDVEVRL